MNKSLGSGRRPRLRGRTRAVLMLSAALVGVLGVSAVHADPIDDLAEQLPLEDSSLYGGPIVLMGIDAEDGGPGGHGPITNYEQLLQSVLDDVRNGGTGVLVIGGGKEGAWGINAFWQQISADTGVPVTFVHGPADIESASFSGFAVIAVSSSWYETYLGLSQEESDALGTRADEVAAFVNGGGGFLAFTQYGLAQPLSYISGLGTFEEVHDDVNSTDITPTPEGEAIGITDVLDLCCWHTSYRQYPEYFSVLATYTNTPGIAAVGGQRVTLCKEDGFGVLADTPLAGTASGVIHDNVEPVVGNAHGALQEVTHSANCTLVVPAEDAVDDLSNGNVPALPALPQAPGTSSLPGS